MAGKPTLSVRERRSWSNKLLAAQEGVEEAIASRAKVIREAYEAGASFAVIETSTGLGPLTVRNAVNGED